MSDLRLFIGNRIRAIRTTKGLTQQKLADIAGLDYRYIGALERGERNFSVDTLEKVLIALNVGIHELVLSFDEGEVNQKVIDEFIIGIKKINLTQLQTIQRINKEIFNLLQ